MKLMASIGRTPRENAPEDEVAQARISSARAVQVWTEVPEARLVPRRPSYLVDEETDFVYTAYRGTVFATGSATIIADRAVLTFYVTLDEQLVFLERVTSPATWTEHVERRERRRLAR